MRISDWSSDVCSSDLVTLFSPLNRPFNHFLRIDYLYYQRLLFFNWAPQVEFRRVVDALRQQHIRGPKEQQKGTPIHHTNRSDRKSVEKGKSVSVREDLGGRRIIKKQKKIQKTK